MALEADPPDPEAVKAARHRMTPGTDAEDWYRLAVGGMWEAATRFEPDRGFVFSTYAKWYLLKWFRDYAHNEAAGGLRVPFEGGPTRIPVTPFGSIAGEDGEADFASTIQDRGEDSRAFPPTAFEVWEAVDRALPDGRDRLILRRRLIDERTLQEVADELGITRERVRQIEGRALRRLKEQKDRFEGFMDDA